MKYKMCKYTNFKRIQKFSMTNTYDFMTKLKFIIFLNFIILLFGTMAYAENVCRTIQIGPSNINDINDIKPCDVVEGSVSIIRIDFSKWNSSLVTQIREITGYLLVYQVYGLQSLELIFPKLAVIRGNTLFGKYSLVLYENNKLMDIGLKSLVNIQKGSIRIENNPTLCFVNTINWIKILSNMKSQHYILKKNKNSTECPTCPEVSINSPTFIPCWNSNNTQRICPDKCGSRACNENFDCCDSMCLSNCTNNMSRFCEICKYFKDVNGECVKTCKQPLKPVFELGGRRCVPQEKCSELTLVTHDGKCMENCPKGFYERNYKCEPCENQLCEKTCKGAIIRTTKDLKNVRGCTEINGSLTIELNEQKTRIIDELENSLSDLKVIQGYLKILKSPQLVTLYFFKNLQIIGGKELFARRYSLYVIENYHLEQLWMTNQTVRILSGKVFFHFNAKLCYETIKKLQPYVSKEDEFSIQDVSIQTNGVRVVCEPHLTNLTVAIEDKNSTAALIKIEPIAFDDYRLHLGNFFYYIEASYQNISMYDNRHGCGHDNWKFDVDVSKNVRHIIKNLRPNTQYAYFVKTFTIATAHIKQDAFSEIQYFTTLPSTPGPVRRFYCHAKNETAIILHWWPPSKPQGKVKKYIIDYKSQFVRNIKPIEGKSNPKDETVNNQSEQTAKMHKLIAKISFNRDGINDYVGEDPRKDENCTCDLENSTLRGPAPEEEDFYDREEIIFEDSLTDFIFIPVHSKHVEPKPNAANATNINVKNVTNIHNTTTTNITVNGNTTNNSTNVTITPMVVQHSLRPPRNNILLGDTDDDLEKKLKLEKLLEKTKSYIDTGPNDFPIIKSEDKCESENYEDCWKNYGKLMIDGSIHKFILDDLSPSTLYKISIRACNENIVKCSIETIIEGRTMDLKISPQT